MAQEATGLNKKAFAERVGLTPSQFSNISRYRNLPSRQAIAKACEQFGFTAEFFYLGQGKRDMVSRRSREQEESNVLQAGREEAQPGSEKLADIGREFVERIINALEGREAAVEGALMAEATPEEEEVRQIFERIDRELPELEARTERLMRFYGL
ncbi:MAG TPA: helix-turn-helix transcriptional regulator [Acetobacteraceae bacterium]|nr:helix-turn-helix transcriptional regulator [Acetobacteraceae bacterium]